MIENRIESDRIGIVSLIDLSSRRGAGLRHTADHPPTPWRVPDAPRIEMNRSLSKSRLQKGKVKKVIGEDI